MEERGEVVDQNLTWNGQNLSFNGCLQSYR
jgi:hypothetical protein